jgi:hypothetical protein
LVHPTGGARKKAENLFVPGGHSGFTSIAYMTDVVREEGDDQ